jgi:hypothetical protein
LKYVGVLLAGLACYFAIRCLSTKHIRREPNMKMKREIEIWKKTARGLRSDVAEERDVKEKLGEFIAKLERNYGVHEVPEESINEMEAKYRITHKVLFINSCIILGIVIFLFFIHSAIDLKLR